MPQLIPTIRFRETDAAGVPLVGGKLYTYAATTSTPKATYTDSTLGTENTNPVILDSRGEAAVWLSGAYKFILKDAADVTIWTEDNVKDLTSDATFSNATFSNALTITGTSVTWSGNPTHSGNHTFSGAVLLNGNVAIGNASTDTLTVGPNVVTWTNDPTHTGNHTFNGVVTFAGSASVHSFGASVGNTDRAGATVLDHYNEVTSFVPVVTGGSTAGAATGASTSCRYTRIGNRVMGSLSIAYSSHSGTGALQISLPIAPAASIDGFTVGSFLSFQTGVNSVGAVRVIGGKIEPLYQGTSTTANNLNVATAVTALTVSFNYEV